MAQNRYIAVERWLVRLPNAAHAALQPSGLRGLPRVFARRRSRRHLPRRCRPNRLALLLGTHDRSVRLDLLRVLPHAEPLPRCDRNVARAALEGDALAERSLR